VGDELLPPQPQLLMLIHDGVDQLPTPVPERQPLAALIDNPRTMAPTTVHLEIAKRMASDPSLIPGDSMEPPGFHSLGNDKPPTLWHATTARHSFSIVGTH
jgi:hypothetical protein